MASTADEASPPQGLFGRGMISNPYPTYHRLRSSSSVLWAEAMGSWVVTRYADVASLLRDPRTSSERFGRIEARAGRPELASMFRMRADAMLNTDAPKHTRLRSLVSKAFTPKAVEAMRPAIRGIVDGLLDAVEPRGRMDLMQDLACDLPVAVIAAMLGVPPEDRSRFKRWSDDIAVTANVQPELSTEALDRAALAYGELTDYFKGIVGGPRGSRAEGLLWALAEAEEQGDKLSGSELYANAILLLNAGHETTTNLIGNGMLALLRNPDQWRGLVAEPSIVEGAVEELLRYDSPVQLTGRTAKEDIELPGQRIAAGQGVLLVLGAANRDPEHFPDPDRLDLRRPEARQHVAFGMGPHYCLGAPLARLEGRIVFETLVRRCPGLRLEVDPPEYRDNFNLRGLKSLAVAF
jgi:pimeloyl-[acyl-carrier protein] synthase